LEYAYTFNLPVWINRCGVLTGAGPIRPLAGVFAIPITWRNRCLGTSKLKLKAMGSRYLFIVAYVWLENILAVAIIESPKRALLNPMRRRGNASPSKLAQAS
jgi:hypothetical protein